MTSVLSVYYYLKIIVEMYFHDPDPEAPFVYTKSAIVTLAIWSSAAGVLWLGLWPAWFWKAACAAVSSMF